MCEMKHSGVEWIGKIPSQWKICRLKNYARIMNGQDYQTVIADDGQYPVIGSGGPFARANAYLYDVESVLLGRKGTIDKPIYINRPFWTVDTMYYTEIQDTAFGKYLYYLCTQIEFGYYQYGSAVPSMTQRDLNNVRFPMPTIQEQQRIADYLDAKCAKIDALITKQQEIIEKLKAYKLSVITEAVTKGLNPNVPMKDSGIKYVAEIPTNWENRKMISILSMRVVDGPHESPELFDEGIPYISATAIEDGKINFSKMRGYISEEYCDQCDQRYKPQLNDILVIKLGASTGQVAMVETTERFNIWVPLAVVRCSQEANPRFIYYAFQADYFIKQMEQSWTYGTQQTLGVKTIERLRILLPSLSEQHGIVEYLDKKDRNVRQEIERRQQIIDKLAEYKKSLIYEIVTGKREV